MELLAMFEGPERKLNRNNNRNHNVFL